MGKVVKLAVGFEAANGFVKTVSDLYEEAYRNTFKEIANPEKQKDLVQKELGKTVFLIDGIYYQVARLDGKSSSGDNVDRYDTYEYKIESLIAIFKHVQKIEKGAEVRVIVTTGVPASHFNVSTVTRDIKGNLLGDYEVNGRKFTIEHVDISLQPLASFATLIFNSDGSPNVDAMNTLLSPDSRVLVIDGGFDTIDYVEIFSGNLEKTHKINGMREVYKNILERSYSINEKVETLSLSEFEVEYQMRNGDQLGAGRYFADVQEVKKQEYRNKASEILLETSKKGLKYEMYNQIILSGGAMLAMAEEVRSEFGDDPRVTILEDSQMRNARGYLIKSKMHLLKVEGAVS